MVLDGARAYTNTFGARGTLSVQVIAVGGREVFGIALQILHAYQPDPVLNSFLSCARTFAALAPGDSMTFCYSPDLSGVADPGTVSTAFCFPSDIPSLRSPEVFCEYVQKPQEASTGNPHIGEGASTGRGSGSGNYGGPVFGGGSAANPWNGARVDTPVSQPGAGSGGGSNPRVPWLMA